MDAKLAQRLRWLGIEFVVIVLGVLSALFVDTWVEDRHNAERAEEYRQRLILDIQRDIANLDAVAHYYRSIRTHGLRTLDDLEGTRRLDDFTLLFTAFNAAEEWAFELESSTYTDLQNTGGLALITDVQLRINLADYYRIGRSRQVVWTLPREYRAAARGIIPNALQAAIHSRCVTQGEDPLSATDSSGAIKSASVEPLTGAATAKGMCGLDPADFDTDHAAAEFRSDPEIPRLLRYRTSQVRVATALFEGHKVLAEELLKGLQTSD